MVKEIGDEIRQLIQSVNAPFVVGIDGLSGAGKTTFVKELERELKKECPVTVIHLDDHIVKAERRYNTGYEQWYEYYSLQWDIEMLIASLFQNIHDAEEITLPFYEKPMDSITYKKIKLEPIILIEGVFLQRNEWIKYYDFTIFLDCPKELRYKRILKRDGFYEGMIDKYKRRYWPAEEYYLIYEKPMEQASKIYRVTINGKF